MRRERLFRILGLLDQELIEEAQGASSPAAVQRPWLRALAAAACVTLLLVGGAAWLITGGFQGYGSAPPTTPAESGSGYTGHEDAGSGFMSYAGPVFPLTALDAADSLSAERALSLDFSPGTLESGAEEVWGASVRDVYKLTNTTDADVTTTLLYPFAGSFGDFGSVKASLSIDGVPAAATLLAGGYAGGFSGILTENGENDGTFNLREPGIWEDYRTLLADGSYLQTALSPEIDLEEPVVVYEFLNSTGNSEEHPAATQSIQFTADSSKTSILTYGINGRSWDEETGSQRCSYFVPGVQRDFDRHLLVVRGEDLGSYTLQGYEDGGCKDGEELDTVSCDVVRTETTLGSVFRDLVKTHSDWFWDGNVNGTADGFSLEVYQQAAALLFLQYGSGSDAPMDRYADGRLDDILQEAMYQDRVFYLAVEVTIPAGGAVEAAASFRKAPSFDFECADTARTGIQGYDLVTGLGSDLSFSVQTVSVSHAENIEIVDQNLGLDPESGVTTVLLDPAQEHYYLEIREK